MARSTDRSKAAARHYLGLARRRRRVRRLLGVGVVISGLSLLGWLLIRGL